MFRPEGIGRATFVAGADTLEILAEKDGDVLLLSRLENTMARPNWTRAAIDLVGTICGELALNFRVITNGVEPTIFYLDDVELELSER